MKSPQLSHIVAYRKSHEISRIVRFVFSSSIVKNWFLYVFRCEYYVKWKLLNDGIVHLT